MSVFTVLMWRHPWRPIRGCPGRHQLSPRASSPSQLLALRLQLAERHSPGAADPYLVLPFADGGGLISYRHADGRHLHTLNDRDGFARKLRMLASAGRR